MSDPLLDMMELLRLEDGACVDLWYPRSGDNPRFLQVGLVCVRAADDIRISYDFDRDGWVVKQETSIDLGSMSEGTGDWREVAFVQAWGSQVKPTTDKAEGYCDE